MAWRLLPVGGMWRENFQERVCRCWNISPAEFTELIFRKALYPHARMVASLIRLFDPNFFRLDFQTIERIGQTGDMKEFYGDLDRFAFLNDLNGGSLRSLLLLRISGRKLVRLQRRLNRAETRLRENNLTVQELEPHQLPA